MNMIYNSPSFCVVEFKGDGTMTRANGPGFAGGFEIVDKVGRREIFIEGALAEQFQQGVQALVAQRPGSDVDTLQAVIDDFIAGYTALAQQPVLLH